MIRIYIFGLLYASTIISTVFAVTGVVAAIRSLYKRETFEHSQNSIFLACMGLLFACMINAGGFTIISKL